jgi:hypothetical protein
VVRLVLLYEHHSITAVALAAYAATGIALRDKSDPSYLRPPTITREPQALPF